jgi:TPR repeat protein
MRRLLWVALAVLSGCAAPTTWGVQEERPLPYVYDRRAQHIAARAEIGHADAMAELAEHILAHDLGRFDAHYGLPRSGRPCCPPTRLESLAVQWLERAATRGHVHAMKRLAELLISGCETGHPFGPHEVERPAWVAAADRWLAVAADVGDDEAIARRAKFIEIRATLERSRVSTDGRPLSQY